MDVTRFLVEPEWPISWLLKIIAERLVADRSPDDDIDDVDEIFETALDKLVPPDPTQREA